MKRRNTTPEPHTPNLDFVYKLGGEFPEGMDVASLCPILSAIADLIRTSNNAILATEKEVTVKVKSFKEGSFLIDLALQAKATVDSALCYVNEDDLKKLKTLLECIGLIAGGGAGLLKLIKFLRAKPKMVHKISPTAVEYTNESGNKLTVNGSVHALYQNCTVVALLDKTLVKPLKLPHVTAVETFLPTNEAQTKVHLTRADTSSLEAVTTFALPESTTANAQSENKQTVWVHPRTGNYEGESTSWSFRKIGDSTAFHAKLNDGHFLDKLKTGEVRLSAKDMLKVELVEVQDIEQDKISRTITQVLEYKAAPVQGSLTHLT